MSAPKPYGFDVTIQTDNGELQRFHKKGSDAAVRRYAIYKKNFKRVVSTDPYTEEQWRRVYGYDGKM